MRNWIVLPLVLALLLVQASAQAAFIEIELDQVLTGDTPDGTAPWLRARFEDTGVSGQVRLTLTSLLAANNFLKGSTNLTSWSFNLNPAKTALLAFAGQSGNLADEIVQATNNVIPSPAAAFDFGFNWSKSGADGTFDGAETAVYLITIAGGGLVATDFDFANANGYLSFAHVQGTSGREGSSKIFGEDDGGGGGVVPEPSSAALCAIGIVSLAAFGRRRRASAG